MRSECLLKMSPAIVTSSPELCLIVCYKDDLAYKPSAMFSKPKYPLKIQIKTWSGKMTNNPYKASVYIALSNSIISLSATNHVPPPQFISGHPSIVISRKYAISEVWPGPLTKKKMSER